MKNKQTNVPCIFIKKNIDNTEMYYCKDSSIVPRDNDDYVIQAFFKDIKEAKEMYEMCKACYKEEADTDIIFCGLKK